MNWVFLKAFLYPSCKLLVEYVYTIVYIPAIVSDFYLDHSLAFFFLKKKVSLFPQKPYSFVCLAVRYIIYTGTILMIYHKVPWAPQFSSELQIFLLNVIRPLLWICTGNFSTAVFKWYILHSPNDSSDHPPVPYLRESHQKGLQRQVFLIPLPLLWSSIFPGSWLAPNPAEI